MESTLTIKYGNQYITDSSNPHNQTLLKGARSGIPEQFDRHTFDYSRNLGYQDSRDMAIRRRYLNEKFHREQARTKIQPGRSGLYFPPQPKDKDYNITPTDIEGGRIKNLGERARFISYQ